MDNNLDTEINENNKAPFPAIDPVDYAGYIRLCDAPFYESNDILNADDVGHKTAIKNGQRLALLWNLFQSIQDPEKWVAEIKTVLMVASEELGRTGCGEGEWMYDLLQKINKALNIK